MLQQYLAFAMKNNAILKIGTSKGKNLSVRILRYNSEMIEYQFKNSEIAGKIRLQNVVECKCEDKKLEEQFQYHMLEEKYQTKDLKKRIQNFANYYMEIIELLLSKEKENSTGYINLNNKKNLYPEMLNDLYKDQNNLLFYYFSKKTPQNIANQEEKETLLIQQANASQKEAIHRALSEKISIIEGPPGTGKTTTIINILANLIDQKQKTLIVSKNNSAIDNIVEELDKMNLPKFYIRLRQFNHYGRTSRTNNRRKTDKI